MNRILGRERPISRRGTIGIALTIALLGGCTLMSGGGDESRDRRDVTVVEETRREAPGLPAWRTGVQAFEEGDYIKAQEIFETLNRQGPTEESRHRALYGLACTRMALAKDGDSFREALGLWERWAREVPGGLSEGDPRMLAPVLRKPLVQGGTGPSDAKKPRPVVSPTFRKQLHEKEDEVRSKDEQLRSKDQEIKRLKEQLEALESIHRTIGEKKKGVTTP
jgi:TolA-binding protein